MFAGEDRVEVVLDPVAGILLVGIFGGPEYRHLAVPARLAADLAEIGALRQVGADADDDVRLQLRHHRGGTADVGAQPVVLANELHPAIHDGVAHLRIRL